MCLYPDSPATQRIAQLRARSGDILAIRPNLFTRQEYWDGLDFSERIMHILRAVQSKRPYWVLCWISAAAVWGLNDTYLMHTYVHIAATNHTYTRNRMYYRFHYIQPLHIAQHNGLLTTTLAQTVFDCARTLPFPQALAICDAALRIYGCTSELQRFIEDLGQRWGKARAQFVIKYADARSENGGESICRAWIITWGYEIPEMQQWITDVVTGQRRRVDFLWKLPDGSSIVLEFDGRQKYTDPAMTGDGDAINSILNEKRRESNLQLNGRILFVRTWYDEVVNRPEALRFKLNLAGVPRTMSRSIPDTPYIRT